MGQDCTDWCLCLRTTYVRMVARSWSCVGAEPAAMLKTMLSTGSKVANSSLVGAAPAIKCHWPRWGSGNWRDNKGSKRGCVPLQRPSNLSGQQGFVGRSRLPFSNWAWIHDRESLNDFPSLPALNNPSNPPAPNFYHVSTLMAKVLIHSYLSLLLSSQYSHPPPPFLSQCGFWSL